jgi:molybdopterin-binding protein
MKISARNVLKGKVVGVEKGQTTAHVRIDIGSGKYHHRLDHEWGRR